LAVADRIHGVTVSHEKVYERSLQSRLVFDDQDPHRIRGHGTSKVSVIPHPQGVNRP
jgi:hypothetical protein